MKDAFLFVLRAIGVGVAAILIAGAIVWVLSTRTSELQHVNDMAQLRAEHNEMPYAISAPVKYNAPDGTPITGVWRLNRATGSVRFCSNDATSNAIECTRNRDGN